MEMNLALTEWGEIVEALQCMGERPADILADSIIEAVANTLSDDMLGMWLDEHNIIWF